MSSPLTYKVYNLPALVRPCDFSGPHLQGWRTSPGVTLLKYTCSFSFSIWLGLAYGISRETYCHNTENLLVDMCVIWLCPHFKQAMPCDSWETCPYSWACSVLFLSTSFSCLLFKFLLKCFFLNKLQLCFIKQLTCHGKCIYTHIFTHTQLIIRYILKHSSR